MITLNHYRVYFPIYFVCYSLFFSIIARCLANEDPLTNNNNNHDISKDSYQLTQAHELICNGSFDQARKFLLSIDSKSVDYALALHSLGNIAAVEGSLFHSGYYHTIAKETDSFAIPPLAKMYMEDQKSCNGIGDIFWTSSFTKKKMSDTFDLSTLKGVMKNTTQDFHYQSLKIKFSEEKLRFLFDLHMGLAIPLEDSGLSKQAQVHFTYASELQPDNLGLQISRLLSMPIVYDSLQHVEDTRFDMEEGISRLLKQTNESNIQLDKLDDLSCPGTFYIPYAGANDKNLMKSIANLYQMLYPDLGKIMINDLKKPSLLLQTSDKEKNPSKIRIGFASHYFRNHSVCKLICGIIHNLNREKFEVYIFSSTDRQDSWTEYVSNDATFVSLKEGFTLQNRDIVKNSNLHILVFPDIGMNTRTTLWYVRGLV